MWKRDNWISVIHYPFHFFSSFLLIVEILLDIPIFKFSRRGSEFPVIYWIFRFLMKYGIRKQISCPCSCFRNLFPTRDFVQDWTFETFRFFLNQLGDLRDPQRRSEALLLICVVVFNSRKYVLKFSNLRGMFFKCFMISTSIFIYWTAGTKHRSQVTGHRLQVIVLPIRKVSQIPLKANLRPNKFLFRPN